MYLRMTRNNLRLFVFLLSVTILSYCSYLLKMHPISHNNHSINDIVDNTIFVYIQTQYEAHTCISFNITVAVGILKLQFKLLQKLKRGQDNVIGGENPSPPPP